MNHMRAQILKLTLLMMLFTSNAVGSPTANPIAKGAPVLAPTPPVVAATSYLLIDADSGKILAEKNSNMRVEPASITKMMTMYVVDNEIKAGKISLNDNVTISKKAWKGNWDQECLCKLIPQCQLQS